MKIGIISEYITNTVNFGNNLQAYALNYVLRRTFHAEQVESIVLAKKQTKQYTKIFSISFVKKIAKLAMRKSGMKREPGGVDPGLVSQRLKCFSEFQKRYIPTAPKRMGAEDFNASDYDAIIVGSDVVWVQYPNVVNRTKFLDFTAQKPFKRIAYAASFGRDYLPKENVPYIRKYLHNFDAISVREHSSVAMLNEIGVPNVSYCLDPTLLLPASHWESLELPPEEIASGEPYIFVYLLGNDARQRAEISAFAKKKSLKIATVPYADGHYIPEDETFGDVRISGCSIENWIWLIHHAQYVITDSFHGTVFSTIFQKPFIVMRRTGKTDINNRMQDYLREIGQTDKVVSEEALSKIEDFTWDYTQINAAIEIRRQNSVAFLNNALGEINA